MSTTPRQQPPHRLPVLTEVVPSARSAPPPVAEVVEAAPPPRAPVAPPAAQPASPAFAATAPAALTPQLPPLPPPPAPRAAAAAAPLSEDVIVQRVLADVQRQLDLVFEYKLRELLAPTLARIADSLIRDTRNELATTLREIVTRAVAQELQRTRGGR